MASSTGLVLKYSVMGITCGNCVQRVQGLVDNLPGVAGSTLDVAGNLDVTWRPPRPAVADADAAVFGAVKAAAKTATVRERGPSAALPTAPTSAGGVGRAAWPPPATAAAPRGGGGGRGGAADGAAAAAVTSYAVSGITCSSCVARVRGAVEELDRVAATKLGVDGALDVTWTPPPPPAADADAAVFAAVAAAGKSAAVRDRPPPPPPAATAAAVAVAAGRSPTNTLSVYTVEGLADAAAVARVRERVAAVPRVAAVEVSALTGVLTVVAAPRRGSAAADGGGAARGGGRGGGGAARDGAAPAADDALVGSSPSLVGRVLSAVAAAGTRATPWQLPGVTAGTSDRPRVVSSEGGVGGGGGGGGGGGAGGGGRAWSPSAPSSFHGSTTGTSDSESTTSLTAENKGWHSARSSPRTDAAPRAASPRLLVRTPRAMSVAVAADGGGGSGRGGVPARVGTPSLADGVCGGYGSSTDREGGAGAGGGGGGHRRGGSRCGGPSDCNTCGAPSTVGDAASIASPSAVALSMVLSSPSARADAAAVGAARGTGGGGAPEVRLTVGGMTCSACVGKAEGMLREVPGVAGARVNLLAARAIVSLTPEAAGSVESATAVSKAAVAALTEGGFEVTVLGMTGVTGAEDSGGGGLATNVTLLRFASHEAAVSAVGVFRVTPGVASARLVDSPTAVIRGDGGGGAADAADAPGPPADVTERVPSTSFDTPPPDGPSARRSSRLTALLRTTSRLLRSLALTGSDAGSVLAGVDEEAPPPDGTAKQRVGSTVRGCCGLRAAARRVAALLPGRRPPLPMIVWLKFEDVKAPPAVRPGGRRAPADVAAARAAAAATAAGGEDGPSGPPPLGTPGVTPKVSVVMAFEEAHGEKLPFTVIPPNEVAGVASATDAQDALRKEARLYLRRFIFATIFTLPLFVMTMITRHIPVVHNRLIQSVSSSADVPLLDLVAWILATPVQFIAGASFYRGAYYAAKKKRSTMDTLIVLGTTIAYGFSVVIVILTAVQTSGDRQLGGVHGESVKESTVFETAALLLTVVLFGKWLEALAKGKAAAGVAAIASLAPPIATLMSPDGSRVVAEQVPVALLSIGDVVLVKPGAGVPVDGEVMAPPGTPGGGRRPESDDEGSAAAAVGALMACDETMLTGESRPVAKFAGDDAYGGTLNAGRTAGVVRASAVGIDAVLARVVRLVDDAQTTRAPIEAFADVVSAVFVPAIVFTAVTTFAVWYGLAASNSVPDRWTASEGDILFSLLFSLAVLVIACPCALGLATPTVVMVATAMGATRHGILFKGGGDALQSAAGIKAILFDKTGTLTRGKPTVCHMLRLSGDRCSSSMKPEPWVLDAIAAAESASEHPLALAIISYVKKCKREGASDSEAEESDDGGDHDGGGGRGRVNADPATAVNTSRVERGRGVTATLADGTKVAVGSKAFITSSTGWAPDARTLRRVSAWESAGATVVVAAVGGKAAVAFGIADGLRPDAAAVVAGFHRKGVEVWMVTGDGKATAYAVAAQVGIPQARVVAEALPWQKVQAVNDAKIASPVSEGAAVVPLVLPPPPPPADLSDSESDGDDSGTSPSFASVAGARRATAAAAADGPSDVAVPVGEELAPPPPPPDAVAVAPTTSLARRIGRLLICRGPPVDADTGEPLVPKRTVAFIGDGINDAPALTAADVGVAMGGKGACTAAAESAAVVLVRAKLADALVMVDLAGAAFTRIRLNYGWALGYNVAAIPVAAGALYPVLERRLPPYMAAVAMAASSLCVVGCALTLRLYRPPVLQKVATVEEEAAPTR